MSDDSGAVAMIMAFSMVFMIGMAAVVVDIGQLFFERRELQNGADAGALAIAENCARATLPCSVGTAADLAGLYADANADDGTSDAAVDPLTFDPRGQVTVQTSTRNADTGDDLVRFLFAPIFGFTGKTVTAHATAEWGAPSRATTLPLTISVCEFAHMVGADPTTGEHILPSGVKTLLFQNPFAGNATIACNLGSAGQDLPGGFGWLQQVEGDCSPVIRAGQVGSVDTGNNTPKGCTSAFWSSQVLNKVVLVPLYNSASGSGKSGVYFIPGFAALEVTGYRLAGGGPTSSPAPCPSSQSCLHGRFVQYVEYDGSVDLGGGHQFGAAVFRLTG